MKNDTSHVGLVQNIKNIANILKPLPAIQLQHLKSNETFHYTDHTPQIKHCDKRCLWKYVSFRRLTTWISRKKFKSAYFPMELRTLISLPSTFKALK